MEQTFYTRLQSWCKDHHVDCLSSCLSAGVSFNDLELWIRGSLPCLEDLHNVCRKLNTTPGEILTAEEEATIVNGNKEACRQLGRGSKYNMDAQTTLNHQYLLLETEPGKHAYMRAAVDLIITRGSQAQKDKLFSAVAPIVTEVMRRQIDL